MRRTLLAAAALVAAGCELREITLTEPARSVVVEAYVMIGREPIGSPPEAPGGATVMLHETLGPDGGSGPVPGAIVAITRVSDGLRILLQESALGNCALTVPVEGSGSCYRASVDADLARLVPGDRLALQVELADGGLVESETTVPGGFDFLNVESGKACLITPGRQSGIIWSRAEGAWAYISDTFVAGLGPFFGQDLVDDPLYLTGLSVSAQDTTIAFPGEFGLFARVELDREVSLALQQGLPPGTSADVTVGAVDRNWVNWARGGNFNPSGLVRIPSARGDGTGVFASGVLRSFRVIADDVRPDADACPGP